VILQELFTLPYLRDLVWSDEAPSENTDCTSAFYVVKETKVDCWRQTKTRPTTKCEEYYRYTTSQQKIKQAINYHLDDSTIVDVSKGHNMVI